VGTPRPRLSAVAGGIALVVLTLTAYAPAMRGGFVWDDDDYVTANETLRSVGGLVRIWAEPGAVPQYYPLTFTSLWLEWRLWGPTPTGYHVTNVLLHATAAVLLWRLLALLALPGAWLAAAIFAVHPVHVESVAWITERKNVLAGVFYLAAALAYLRPRRRYWLAFALFVCALLAKTVACTLPVALALVLWWRSGRVDRRELAALVPFVAVGAALGVVTVWMEHHHVGARGVHWNLSFVDRCLVAGRAVWFYAGKLAWPARLTFIYPRWHVDAGEAWQWAFPVAALALVAMLVGACGRIGRGPLVAVLFFVVTLAPALGFVDVYPMRYSFVADHFQYLASIGPIALAAALLFRAGLPCSGIAILLAVLAVLASRQSRVYASPYALWEDTLAKNPAADMAHVNLGMLHYRDGRPEPAIEHFAAALRLVPADAEVRSDLGMALVAAGRTEEAMAAFAESLRLDPSDPRTHNNRANLLAQTGHTGDAIAEYEEAIRLDPGYPDAQNNLATALAFAGRTDEALVHYAEAVRLDPRFAEAHRNVSVLLAERGRPAEALAHAEAALRVNPADGAARLAAANALVALGRTREAVVSYRAALAAQPGSPETLARLAWLLAVDGEPAVRRPDEAVALAERACGLTANADPVMLDVLAAAYAAAGRFDRAAATARRGMEVATAAGRTDVAREIEGRLAAYDAGRTPSR